MRHRRTTLSALLGILTVSGLGCASLDTTEPEPGNAEEPMALDCDAHDCRVAEIAAGGFLFPGFTCARLVSGRVACWGGHGMQLADGTPAPKAPTLVPGVDDALAISSGGMETCALRAGGNVTCWGQRLGDFGTQAEVDRAVVDVPGLTRVRQVATGGTHACAVRQNRTVQCWGTSALGALGSPGEFSGSAPPRPVPGLDGVRQVALGFDHSCALRNDGSVWCWGANDVHQLGTEVDGRCRAPLGEEGDEVPCALEPVRVAEGALVIAAGASSTCALWLDGTLRCWGYLGEGRTDVVTGPSPCGDEDPADGCMPRPTHIDLPPVVEVALGKEHACVRLDDATTRCWGSNRAGQLGDGTLESHPAPGVDPGLSSAEQIAAGRLHTCALLEDGDLRCWGDDEGGQLGIAAAASATCTSIVDRDYPCEPHPTAVALDR